MLVAQLALASALAAQTPEQRAIEYLSHEVPRWSRENKCFSCHNNGDAARALYTAVSQKIPVPKEALAATSDWLLKPERWSTASDPAGSDKKLARIQFAVALLYARDAGLRESSAALVSAARSLLPYQANDGSFPLEDGDAPGSPATYGTALGTYMTHRVLQAAGLRNEAQRAADWLKAMKPRNVMETAVLLLVEPDSAGSIRRLLSAQTSDGGWGPILYAPAEAFDTALVLLALHGARKPEQTAKAIARGRQFLIKTQQSSGGWPETTRPAGSQSYAQHISTTGWATLALLETRPERQ